MRKYRLVLNVTAETGNDSIRFGSSGCLGAESRHCSHGSDGLHSIHVEKVYGAAYTQPLCVNSAV